jgi:hypothetical protein
VFLKKLEHAMRKSHSWAVEETLIGIPKIRHPTDSRITGKEPKRLPRAKSNGKRSKQSRAERDCQ